jgi:hypothetical protein
MYLTGVVLTVLILRIKVVLFLTELSVMHAVSEDIVPVWETHYNAAYRMFIPPFLPSFAPFFLP